MGFRLLFASLLMLSGLACAQTTISTFDSNGTAIRFAETGSGEAVVLLHGWMSDASFWGADSAGDPRLTGLAGFRVLAPDLRGHGKSGKPHDPKAYGVEMAEDVLRLLDHLKIRKAHLVGYSMGSYVAGKVVERAPDRIFSVVYGGSAPVLRTRAIKAFGDAIAFADAVDAGKGLGAYLIATIPPGYPKPTPEAADRLAERMFRHQDVVALAAAGRSLGGLEVDPARLTRSGVPTLFIYGERESRYVLDRIAETRRWFPNAQYTTITGTDHVLTPAAPELGHALVEFLQRHRESN